MTTGVYEIKNKLNGKAYLGSSGNIERRRSNHYYLLRSGRHHCVYLQRAWNKHGEKAFEFSILEEIEGPGPLLAAEQTRLDRRFAQNTCYNMAITAGPAGPLAEETKRKLSLAIMGRKLSEEHKRKIGEGLRGNKNRLGTKHSDERKRKMSAAMMGNQYALGNQNAKGNKYWLGKRHTEETKRKLSEAKMGELNPMWGKHPTEETRRKIGRASLGNQYALGYKHTDETKRKIRAGMTGKQNALGHKHTDEARRKMREAWKRRKAKERERASEEDIQ